jgi:hypothetical protein
LRCGGRSAGSAAYGLAAPPHVFIGDLPFSLPCLLRSDASCPLVSVYSLDCLGAAICESYCDAVAAMAHSMLLLHVCMRVWHPSLYRFPSRSQMVSVRCSFPVVTATLLMVLPLARLCACVTFPFSLWRLRYSYALCPPSPRLRPRLSWCSG